MLLRRILSAALLLAACAPAPSTAPLPSSTPTPSVSPSSPQPTPEPMAPLTAAQGNVIPNPGAEQASDGQVADWVSDAWGEQESAFSWASDGAYSGQKYLSVSSQNHQSGDAKWIFGAQRLEPDSWYEYSDVSRADGRNRLIQACRYPDGQRRFYTIGQSHASTVWQRNAVRFYSPAASDCELSVFHILDRSGYLHTDHHQLVKVAPKPLKRPLVSVSFDDIYATAATTGAAELAARGWRGTFYVTGKFARLNDTTYAHPELLRQLQQAGHEVGSHASTHPYLSELPVGDLIGEIQGNRNYLTDVVGEAPAGIAYPFGDFDGAVEAEVQRFHRYARTSLVGLNDATLDPYRLRIVPVTRTTTTAELLSWVDDAARSSTWLILLYHDLQEGEEGDPDYTTSTQQYIDVLDHVKAQNLTVLTVEEALAEVRQNAL
ncbi:MAG: polysaccharide deacetylase family protein [Candidatus Sericytochromatia bacterium]